MSTIIKRGGKFYRQEIEEEEVDLQGLEAQLAEAKRDKTDFISKETQDRDNQIAEIENEIDQLKGL